MKKENLERVEESAAPPKPRTFPFMFVAALFLMALMNYVGGHFSAWWAGIPTGIIIGILAVREADRVEGGR